MNEARSLTYSINVQANTSQAETNIRSLTSEIGGLKSSTLTISADSSQASANIRGISGSLGGLSSQATSVGGAFRGAFLDSIDSGNKFADSIKSGIGGALSYSESKADELKNNVVQGAQSIANSFSHPIETIKNGFGNALQGAKDKFVSLARGADTAADSTDDVGNSAKSVKKDVENLGDAAESSGTKFEKLGAVLKGTFVALGIATAAVGAFAGASVSTGMTFDTSMSQVAATMGYSVDELNTAGSEANKTYTELRNFAMDMGASTAFSASEAADALNYMALAGYDADTSMSMLPNVLNLAAAGGIDLAAASDMVTDAQSALGLTLDDTTVLVDQMAMTASKSNTSVEQLGNAILAIGGTAKNLAGGTTELNSALGILADNGIKGAEGGTHLRNIILSLASPSDTAAKAIKSLGLEVFDADGNMRPLNETFGDLQNILSTMSQGDQLAAIGDVFNTTDIASVNALLSTSADRWDELGGYIDSAAGSAGDMAAVQLDNLDGDITLFKSALEGAQIVISDKLTPNLREFVQFGSTAVSTLSEAFRKDGLSGAMGALGDVLSDGIGMVINMLPTMIDAGMQLLSALGQGVLDNAPILIAAAAQIVVMLASGIGDALPTMIPAVTSTLLTIVDTLIDNLPLLLDAGMSLVDGLIEGIVNAAPSLVSELPVLITGILDFMTENLPAMLEQGSELLLMLANGIISAVPQLVAQLPAIITGVVGFISNNLPAIAEQGVSLTLQLAAGILLATPQLVAQLPALMAAIVSGIGSMLGSIVEVGKNIVKGLWEGIASMGSWIKDKVTGFFGGIVSNVKGLLGIHSPSTVFAGIGDNMALGLGSGFEKSMVGVTERIEDAVPTEIGAGVQIPTVSDSTYTVEPLVEGAETASAVTRLASTVSDFNPPDVNAESVPAVGKTGSASLPESKGTDSANVTIEFSPNITVHVNGSAEQSTIDRLQMSLRDTVKELFEEFRQSELEQMTLKNQYAF